MKRLTRRMLGVFAGLALGWYAAGVVSMATTDPASDQQAAGTPPHVEHAANDMAGGQSTHGSAQADYDNPAEVLAPHRHQIPWLGPVLVGAALLFLAAVVLGIPVLKLKGPDPPDPAAVEH